MPDSPISMTTHDPDAAPAERGVVADSAHDATRVEHKPAPGPLAPGGDASNYIYWQQHGGEWADEYDQRKLVEPRYHIQELMLAEYVERHAEHARSLGRKLRVLEYGCGVGRHLRNLSRIPNADVFGYDQSPTMVSCMQRWTDAAWIEEHVRLGPPTGSLPWDDGSIDIVYSCEVMVHVRPEDLPGRIAEMVRVSRGQVLLMEPSPHYRIVSGAHDGCWNHDIPSVCASMGLACEVMPSGFFSQTPFRIVVGDGHPWGEISPLRLAIMRRMESDLLCGLEEVSEEREGLRSRARDAESRLGESIESRRATAQRAHEMEKRLDDLQQRLAAAKASLEERGKRVEDLREEIREARGLIEQKTQRARELADRNSEITQRLEALRADLARLREQAEKWRESVRDSGAQLALARGRAASAERAAHAAAQRAAEATGELDRVRAALRSQLALAASLAAKRSQERHRDHAHVTLVEARDRAFVDRAHEIMRGGGDARD